MVDVITIRVSGDVEKTIASLKRIRKLPQLTSEGLMEWGKILEKDIKAMARMRGILSSSGELYKTGIKWRQRPKGKVGRLFIRNYGVALDSMPPHYVNIQSSRTRFLAWARKARFASIRRRAEQVASGEIKSFSIRVVPHPYIRDGYDRARKKFRELVLKRPMKRAITA